MKGVFMSRATEVESVHDLNLSVIIGEVTTEPSARELSNGDTVTSFDVVTFLPHGRVTVPILVDGDAEGLEIGQKVFVCGVTRRRFFRTGAGISSRTEVVADVVIPVRRKTQVQRALLKAVANLKDFTSV